MKTILLAVLVLLALGLGTAAIPKANSTALWLFSPSAGFTKAKLPSRESITVCDASGLGVRVGDVIAPWNRIAGWSLFRAQCPGDVTFQKATSTWVQPLPSATEPFTSCIIWAQNRDTKTMRHEIGHCLGIVDSIYSSMDASRYVNPAVCDNSADPRYSAYKGALSYCNFNQVWRWFGPDDVATLQAAGYK